MTQEKICKEVTVLADFIQCYCDGNHQDSHKEECALLDFYNGESCDKERRVTLCAECRELFLYAYGRLQACPHEEKPRCRFCKHPCYEKRYWKAMGKMMRYSGVLLGLVSLRDKIFKGLGKTEK